MVCRGGNKIRSVGTSTKGTHAISTLSLRQDEHRDKDNFLSSIKHTFLENFNKAAIARSNNFTNILYKPVARCLWFGKSILIIFLYASWENSD